MTKEQKQQIHTLRRGGLGYKKIASSMGISVNTVKSFCRNNELTGSPTSAVCLFCGKPLVQIPKRKQRKFCSIQCRETWWSRNRDKGNKPTGETCRCAHCGRIFSAYRREHRKYCSHACYVAERFQGGGVAKTMRAKGLITADEYAEIDTVLLAKYQPYLGRLISENA